MYPENNYSRSYTVPGRGRTLSLPKVMQNVYIWMTLALTMTGLTAMAVATQPQIISALYGNSFLLWGLLLAEIGIVVYLSSRIMRMSFTTAGLLFALYAVLNGVTLSAIFLIYTAESIAQTFFITAGTFGAMAAVGLFVKKDLSGLGRFLFMTLIGLIVASLANWFFKSEGLALVLNYVGVLLFAGLTAYDTQKIKVMLQQAGQEESESTMKIALLGSLTLYLDFINLFLYLLRFFGSRD